MTDEMTKFVKDTYKQLAKIFIIAMICMAVVCSVACISMAFQVTAISEDYFNYNYEPPDIINTQTNNN